MQQNPKFLRLLLGVIKMRLIIIVIALLGLVACSQSSQSEEQITVNRSIPKDEVDKTTVPAPEKVPFIAKVSAPNQIKSNQEFVVEATLTNLSDNDLTIQHASGVFYFSIKDSNGKGVNTFAMAMVGIVRTFQGNGSIIERYTYKLEKPGFYEVSATAIFTVGEVENKKDFKIETNRASFEVIPLN